MVGDAWLLIFGYHWTQERLAKQKPITKILPHLAQLIYNHSTLQRDWWKSVAPGRNFTILFQAVTVIGSILTQK